MDSLHEYAIRLVENAGQRFASGEVFAKVLTTNDDSGRHGVLIPSDAYLFFPSFQITDPTQNETMEFAAINVVSGLQTILAYKYYERYPERRITRLHSILNARDAEPRLVVFLRAKHIDGSTAYYFDCANSAHVGRFSEIFRCVFGADVTPVPGSFVIRPVESEAFASDDALTELLGRFDDIRSQGWVDSLRRGDTGIGYTFETLLGIEENNEQTADFRGIEIKCKGIKEDGSTRAEKINLFQAGPTWIKKLSSRERIRLLGKVGEDGLYTCYSQLTTAPNNLGLFLHVAGADQKINLRKQEAQLGYWPYTQLQGRLAQKHSRAIFVKARTRSSRGTIQFFYEELVYCNAPSIERFVSLVNDHNLVFEFTMSEKKNGTIRNHGYPWRLIREEFIDQLYAFQIKLR